MATGGSVHVTTGSSSKAKETASWLVSSQQTSRRLHVWLKHSISNVTVPEATFDETIETENNNIDEALACFYRKDDVDDVNNNNNDIVIHDWILDGHPEWKQQAEKTNQLFKQLQGEPFNIHMEEMKLVAGSIGKQEYQFAHFDDSNDTNHDENDQNDNNSDFGDFQGAAEEDFGDLPQGNEKPLGVTVSRSSPGERKDGSASTVSDASASATNDNHHDHDHAEPPTPITDNRNPPVFHESETEDAIPNQEEEEEEEENTLRDSLAGESWQSSIPSVVRFTSTSPNYDDLVIPTTVRLSPNTNDTNTPTSTPGRRSLASRRRVMAPQVLDYNIDEDNKTAIASTHGNTSIASPEGRFLRRHSQFSLDQELDDDDIDIPPKYLENPDLDDTLTILQSIDWEFIPHWQMIRLLDPEDITPNNCCLVQDDITIRLSELDAIHSQVTRRLHKNIQPHVATLQNANHQVYELAKYLSLAQMYVERSRRSVSEARGDIQGQGVVGAVSLLQSWDSKQHIQCLQTTLSKVSSILELESKIQQRIAVFDVVRLQEGTCCALLECREIMDLCELLQSTAYQDPDLLRLECLENLRERAGQITNSFVTRLHVLLESITARACCCHGLEATDYQVLVQAVLHVTTTTSAATTTTTTTLSSSWSTSIYTALTLEADRALALALLDPSSNDNMEESKYDKELIALNYQLDQYQAWGDSHAQSSKLRTMIHNLVTIRFDFESHQCHLPAVYHRLCLLLTNVLYGQHCLLDWHRHHDKDSFITSDSELACLKQVLQVSEAQRVPLWNHCLKVLEKCVDEYLPFCGKNKLFEWNTNTHVDSKWWEDLNGLHEIGRLTEQFLSMQAEFLGTITNNDDESLADNGESLYEKLYTLMKKHLRAVHVEAMNTMGMMLAQEDWSLVPFKRVVAGAYQTGENPDAIVQQLLLDTMSVHANKCSRNRWSNRFLAKGSSVTFLDYFDKHGNPFQGDVRTTEDQLGTLQSDIAGISVDDESCDEMKEIYNTISRSCGSADLSNLNAVPKSVRDGVLLWFSRLLIITQRLPRLAEDVCEVFANIVDLYITTVFRICCGSSSVERVVLGIDPPQRHSLLEAAAARPQGASSPLFGFRRSSSMGAKPARPTPTLSSSLNAELCAPLPSEVATIMPLRTFIQTAQDSLKAIVKLDRVDTWVCDPSPDSSLDFPEKSARVLEKRHAAAWSCLFVAAALDKARDILRKNLHQAVENDLDPLAMLHAYVASFTKSVAAIVDISMRIACFRSIRAKSVVQEIILLGNVWEEAKLHEQPNLYIETLCDFYALIWSSLCHTCKLPPGATELLWQNLVSAGYVALLDGFSKIPFCSTEGRALMSMDLASFNAGTSRRSLLERLEDPSSCSPPPAVLPSPGMAYVDTFIKVFYYPRSDVMGWIKNNYEMYQFNHCVALIAGASSSDYDKKSISEFLTQIKQLYSQSKHKMDGGYYDI